MSSEVTIRELVNGWDSYLSLNKLFASFGILDINSRCYDSEARKNFKAALTAFYLDGHTVFLSCERTHNQVTSWKEGVGLRLGDASTGCGVCAFRIGGGPLSDVHAFQVPEYRDGTSLWDDPDAPADSRFEELDLAVMRAVALLREELQKSNAIGAESTLGIEEDSFSSSRAMRMVDVFMRREHTVTDLQNIKATNSALECMITILGEDTSEFEGYGVELRDEIWEELSGLHIRQSIVGTFSSAAAVCIMDDRTVILTLAPEPLGTTHQEKWRVIDVKNGKHVLTSEPPKGCETLHEPMRKLAGRLLSGID